MEPEPKPETKVCKKCGRELPITKFALNKNLKDGHVGQCRDCVNAYQRENYARKKRQDIRANQSEPRTTQSQIFRQNTARAATGYARTQRRANRSWIQLRGKTYIF